MKRQIQIKNADHYLFIPIQVQQEKKTVLFSCGDRIITELRIPVGVISNGEYKYNYLACIPLWLLSGDILSVEGDVSKDFLDTIFVNSHVEKQILNHPHIHFAAEYGWINDPNGLVYCNGLYHLYFQYNPFDTTWDNMSWGHAVSKDLLHWEQRDMALLPDDDGMIFSGCGLINKFGLLDLPKDSLLYFYSAAGGSNRISKGKEFIQKVAYSLDEGNTLIKTDSGIIPTICKENRDPKVFWHEKTNAYIMCLWLEHSEFVILRSIDLKEWKISQRFTLDQGFECPDLFELPVEQGGDKVGILVCRWVLLFRRV